MSIYNPDMWIMKITPGGSGNTKMFFENLFIKEDCKNLIGYTKEEGEIEKFSTRWHKIKIGDLIVVIEGYNRVFGVVEITSDPFDDENEEGQLTVDVYQTSDDIIIKTMVAGVKPASSFAPLLQPVKNSSPPINAPPVSIAICFRSSLLSMVNLLLVICYW